MGILLSMEFQKGDGFKFINVRHSSMVFKRFKNLFLSMYIFICEIMIKFIWCIVKCRFLLERSIRR